MSGTQAPATTTNGKRRLAVALAGTALVLGAVAARQFLGPQASQAQAPGRGFAPNKTAQQRGPVQRAGASRAAKQRPAPVVQRTAAQAPAATLATLKTMALVNGQAITRDTLIRECMLRYGKEVLESLVNKHLIWHACQQQQIMITEQDVDDEIKAVASKFGLSVDRWLQLLREERDIPPSKYRREIIWPTLALRKLATGQITVTQEELRRAMDTEYGPKVKARMISCKTKARAEQLLAAIRKSPDQFGNIAKDHSEDPNSASARGLIPPIRKHMGDPQLESIAFKLKEGEISPVIPVAGQFVILKCEKQLPETYIPSQNLEAVTKRLGDSVRDDKLREAASGLFKRLQEQAKVVNVYNDPQLRQQQPNVAATINGRPLPIDQLGNECLERHGLEVLEGEINRLMLQQELSAKSVQVSQQDITAEVARAADAYGYLKNGQPDVAGWLKAVTEADGATEELYLRDAVWPSVALKQLVKDRASVTNEDLQKGFESNYGERVQVQAIVFASHRQAQKVWSQAKADNTEEFFGRLAYQYSIEPVSRSNYGRVPPIRKHSGQQKMEEEAFRLQPGELSGIVVTGDKYVLLRCLGRTKPEEMKLAEVRDELYKDILERKIRVEMAKEFDRVHDKARVENFLGRLVNPTQSAVLDNPPAPATRQR